MNQINPISDEKNNEPKTQSFYLPELDILRFYAFFAVFIHHLFPNSIVSYQGKLAPFAQWIVSIIAAGGFGVDLFFALSSYLITELLIKEDAKTGKIHATNFYLRRALRIFPLYYTFVLMSMFVFPQFQYYLNAINNQPLSFPHNLAFLLLVGNWTCVFFGLPKSFALPLWSISVEEQFYIVFPFLIGFLGINKLKALAIAFLALATISQIILVFMGADYYGFWCNSFVRLDSIAGGILLSVFLRNGRLRLIEKLLSRILICLFSIFLYLFAARYLSFFGSQALIAYPIVALASSLIIWAVLNPNKIKTTRYIPLIYLGRISYGLYVIHLLCITLADKVIEILPISANMWIIWRLIISLLFTIILAAISYTFLEKPFLKLKKRFTFVESRPI